MNELRGRKGAEKSQRLRKGVRSQLRKGVRSQIGNLGYLFRPAAWGQCGFETLDTLSKAAAITRSYNSTSLLQRRMGSRCRHGVW